MRRVAVNRWYDHTNTVKHLVRVDTVMPQLQGISSADRFERFRWAFIMIACGGVLAYWIHEIRLSDASSFATKYSPLFNLVLTIVLVLLTAVYAWITYVMARELTDSRRAAIRPLFVLDVGGPEVDVRQFATLIRTKITLSNVGRGQAIRARVRCGTPHLVGDITPDLPNLFPPGGTHSCEWSIPMDTEFEMSRDDFFEVDTIYEDAEGNIYQLLASYDLQQFPSFKAFRPNREALFLLPLHLRRALREPTAIYDSHRAIRLYERRW